MFTAIFEALSNFIINVIFQTGLWGVFLLMTAESACIPVPSEVILPFAGFLVAEGKLSFWGATFAGALGNLFGSLLAYFLGQRVGLDFLKKYGKYILISKKDIEIAHKFFEKYGQQTVFFSRLLPVVRTFISLPAGVAKMNLKKFITLTFLGSFLWSIFLLYLGIKMQENWQKILDYFHKFDLLIGISVILLIILYIKRHLKEEFSESN